MENLHTTDCIRTYTGKYMNVFEPTLDMIDIEDIAHALSNLCRWGGHIPKFYSVAEHSVHCSDVIDASIQLSEKDSFSALMHDATEAYLVDVPRPIKNKLLQYKDIEDGLMKVIAEKFGVQYPFTDEVHFVDNLLLQLEWDALVIGQSTVPMLKSYSPEEAKAFFMDKFNKLYK